ncbi:MAG TPA: YbjN domain-containing protein [Actinomycetes bacterium]|nr:YbjN domain-containing protein [Actinomycetes bacterium]
MTTGEVIRKALDDLEVPYEESSPGTFVAVLPGERKLRTTVSLVVGPHSLTINAFVVRHPDENVAELHKWLLQYNAKHPGVAFGIDPLGDVYVVGQLPLGGITPEVVDQMLGRVLDVADSSFNTLLELGFAASIRREWAWRVSRGESLANLQAFTHLVEAQASDDES